MVLIPPKFVLFATISFSFRAQPVLNMKFATLAVLATSASAAAESLSVKYVGPSKPLNIPAVVNDVPNENLCDVVGGDLPSECDCTPNDIGGDISCSFSLFSDEITLSANVQPCASPADIAFEIQDTTFDIDYTKTVSMDDTEQFDIPGLTFGIPDVATASAVMDVTVGGDLDDVTLTLALDACATVAGFSVCGSDLTSELPWTVLEGSYDFSNICQ